MRHSFFSVLKRPSLIQSISLSSVCTVSFFSEMPLNITSQLKHRQCILCVTPQLFMHNFWRETQKWWTQEFLLPKSSRRKQVWKCRTHCTYVQLLMQLVFALRQSGLPDFSRYMIPKPENCTKWTQNVPNGHKISKISVCTIFQFHTYIYQHFPI
jgi:hypothetical protein